MKKRISLLLIAVLLAVTTLSLGLTNTLTDYKMISATTSLAKTGDFGLVLTQPTLDPILFPGQEYAFDVTVTSSNNLPAYLIAQIILPPDFVVDGKATFSPEGWTQLETSQSGESLSDIYYYGSNGETTVFSDSSTLMSTIHLADYVEVLPANAADVNYDIQVQVWAFQKTSETEVMSPGALWEEVKNEWLSEP